MMSQETEIQAKPITMRLFRMSALIGMFMVALVAPAQAAELPIKDGQKIAFMGDSITAAGTRPGGYVRLVIRGLEVNGVKTTAITAGISGHKSDQMLERLERDVLNQKPDWMTLSCGVNDVWHGDRGIPLDQYKVNITKIVDRCQAAGVKVMILTSTMIGEDEPNKNNQKLAEYNKFLVALAHEKKCLLADLNTDMQAVIEKASDKKKGKLLTSDGVHMNADGNKMMATGLLKAFGLGEVQIAKAHESWEPKPEAAQPRQAKTDIFPSDRVLDVQITVTEEDWDTIRYQSRNIFKELGAERKEGPIEHPYTYVNASVTIDGVKFPDIGLRKKGFIGSQSTTRPSLKLKLNHVDKSAGIEGLTSLTLNNNKQDTSQISQFMGYALFNAAGSPAPRCAYAKVTVNGKKLGIYSHVETMRRPLYKRAFETDEGILYEGTVVDFYEGWENSFEKKFGEDEPGRKKIAQLTETLGESKDDDLEKAIGDLVDLDAFYTFWAVEGLIGFWDGYSGNTNNYHFYLNPKTDKLHFLPWGLDAAFTRYSKIEYDPEAPLSVKTKGLIAHKLYQLKSGRERYAKTLKELLDKHWNEKILIEETKRIEALVTPHLEASQKKSFRSMEETREFIRTRKSELLAEIAEGMPVWTRVPEEPLIISDKMFGGGDKNSIWATAKRGDVVGLKMHLAKGTEVNAKDPSGTTPLAMAVVAGEINAAKFLLARDADVDAKNLRSDSVLHGAAFLGRFDIAKLLIAKKVKLNVRNQDGSTPLDSAAAPWSEEIQGALQFISGILQIKLDEEEVKSGREKVAALLRKNGAKYGAELPKATGEKSN